MSVGLDALSSSASLFEILEVLSVSGFAEVWNYRSGFQSHDYVFDGPVEFGGFEFFDCRFSKAGSREKLPLFYRDGFFERVVLAWPTAEGAPLPIA